MRDAVEVLKNGIPTVLVCQEIFESAARNLSRALGFPDLPLIVVEQPKGWQTHEDEHRKAQESIRGVVDALTAPAPRAASS